MRSLRNLLDKCDAFRQQAATAEDPMDESYGKFYHMQSRYTAGNQPNDEDYELQSEGAMAADFARQIGMGADDED